MAVRTSALVGGVKVGVDRRRGDRRRSSRPAPPARSLAIVLVMVVGTLALLGLGMFLPSDGAITLMDGAIGVLAIGVALATPKLLGREAPATNRTVPSPALDLADLGRRIGAVVEDAPLPAPSAERRVAHPISGLFDTHFFAVLAIPRFERARADGARGAVVVLSVDVLGRVDGPVQTPTTLPLSEITAAVRRNIRARDIAARSVEGEYILYLDRCDPLDAQAVVERLSRAVAAIPTPAGRLALSAGIAFFPDCGVDLHTLLQRADGVLRGIKRSGVSAVRPVPTDWAALPAATLVSRAAPAPVATAVR